MIPRTLEGQVAWLAGEVAELRRRDRNRKRTGTIAEVDTAKGLARVKLSRPNGRDYLGPWMPWKEIAAGGIKTHIPPTVGEQVDVMSETGDLTDGVIDMSTPSNANPRPHDGPEAVITKGDVRVTIGDDIATVDAPKVLVNSPNVQLGGDGGKRVARIGDKVNVGSGSSTGMWPIVEGSSRVFAVD